jgi:hypothetical protein
MLVDLNNTRGRHVFMFLLLCSKLYVLSHCVCHTVHPRRGCLEEHASSGPLSLEDVQSCSSVLFQVVHCVGCNFVWWDAWIRLHKSSYKLLLHIVAAHDSPPHHTVQLSIILLRRGRQFALQFIQNAIACSGDAAMTVPVKSNGGWDHVKLCTSDGSFVWLPGSVAEQCLADVGSIIVPSKHAVNGGIDLCSVWRHS